MGNKGNKNKKIPFEAGILFEVAFSFEDGHSRILIPI